MKTASFITTSWDDGHPLDFRVADLLVKHGLPGTFYVPRRTKTPTMTDAQVRELSRNFEMGAHTLDHTDLSRTTPPQAWQAIVDSKAWIEDTTDKPCLLFCPPFGRFTVEHLNMMRRGGYVGMRGAEAMSLALPRPKAGLMILPTTVQAHPHGLAAYGRNMLKRAAFRNFWLFITRGRSTNWASLAHSLLHHAVKSGGVFHLWGHSWELEENQQWQRLDEVLRFVSQFTTQARVITNSELCQQTVESEPDTETGRQGDKETRRQEDEAANRVSLSPCLPVSLSRGETR